MDQLSESHNVYVRANQQMEIVPYLTRGHWHWHWHTHIHITQAHCVSLLWVLKEEKKNKNGLRNTHHSQWSGVSAGASPKRQIDIIPKLVFWNQNRMKYTHIIYSSHQADLWVRICHPFCSKSWIIKKLRLVKNFLN
jgi:hypothetical protein